MKTDVRVAELEEEIGREAMRSEKTPGILLEDLKLTANTLPHAEDLPSFEALPLPEPQNDAVPDPAPVEEPGPETPSAEAASEPFASSTTDEPTPSETTTDQAPEDTNSAPAAEPPFHHGELSEKIDYLRSTAYLPYYWEFSGGALKRFFKRLIRKLCKCLIPPILSRQNSWNYETANVLTELYDQQTGMKAAGLETADAIAAFNESTARRLTQLESDQAMLSAALEQAQAELDLLKRENAELRRSADEALSSARAASDLANESERLLLARINADGANLFPRVDSLEERTGNLERGCDARLTALENGANIFSLEERTGNLERGCDARLTALEKRASSLEEHALAADRRSGSIEQAVGGIHVQVQALDRASDAISASAARLLVEARRGRVSADPASPTAVQRDSAAPSAESGDLYEQTDYFRFENRFRGTRSLISERQKMYLPYFKNAKASVLDLGCGRGEFLCLLRDAGIPAYGIDLYEEFVAEGELNGIDVRLGDAIAFLKNSSERFGGIFAGQLIEHLSNAQLLTLCREAYRVLEDGACLILETPNPMCLSVFANSFYLDPTHEKPVHPLYLQALLKDIGFSEAEIVFTEPSRLPALPELKCGSAENLEAFNAGIRRVSELLFGSQDYAIIARK